MRYLDEDILEMHPEEHVASISKFLVSNWSGTNNIEFSKGQSSGKDPLQSLLFDVFIQGWTKGLDRYLNESICDLQDAISLRKKHLMSELSLMNSDLACHDDFARQHIARKDAHFNADYSLQLLNKMLIKLKRGQMHADIVNTVVHDSFELTSKRILMKFTGFKSLFPIGLSKLLKNHPGEKTLIELLSQSPYSQQIDAFEGFSLLNTSSKFCIAHELSAPVVAWKTAENSLVPLNQLVLSITSYAYNLRLYYNHYSIKEQVVQAINCSKFQPKV